MKKLLLISTLGIGAMISSLVAQIPLGIDRAVITNERNINSEELEFSPVFYKDGIVFISTRYESLMYNVKDKNIGGKNIMSIYRSRRNDEGFLQEPFPLADELLFRLHEGPVTFDRTGETIFFTRNESLKTAPDGFKKLQIYAARKEGNTWTDFQKLSFNNVNYNYSHPTISPDEDVLFISSDLPGGYGGMDLYAVYRVNGRWTQMINLGSQVNTTGNEVFPYIAADKTLYFASDGHGGHGNLDIFYTREDSLKEEWRMPVNLGVPFNSQADDFGLIVDRDNKNGYFSSDRKGGFGDDDIYSFYIEAASDEPIAGTERNLNQMVVTDENGNPLPGVEVSAINFDEISLSAGNEQVVRLKPGVEKDNFILDIRSDGLGEDTETGTDGRPDLTLKDGEYVIKVAKDGYLPKYIIVTPDTDLEKLNVTLIRAVDCIALSGKVMHQNGGGPVSGAAVKIMDAESGETVTVYSDASGTYEYCIKCNHSFSIYAERNGVVSPPVVANTAKVPCSDAEGRIDVTLYLGGSPIYAGMTITLPNIYFNFDDATLRPDAYRDLDEVVEMLNNYPGMEVELASHTDARGTTAYNQDLSNRRTASVMNYITSKGIAENRLEPRGYGESQIRNHCKDGVICSESEHQYNRRTEVKILELGEEPLQDVPYAGSSENSQDYSTAVISYNVSAEEGKGGQELVRPAEGTTSEETPHSEGPEDFQEGDFAVIAGTFANHDYAVRRAELLMDKGYVNTSIVRQTHNGLYAVYVRTFYSKQDALALIKELSAKEVHAYVMKK